MADGLPVTAPELIIGLGETGCRIAGLMLAHAAQTHPPAATRSLRTLGIGFDAPPSPPPGGYVRLRDDISTLLAQAGPVPAWLDVNAYQAQHRLPDPLPRPLERMALFADLQLGKRSRVVNSILGQWVPAHDQTGALSVSVVAALAEPAAGSILIDILHLIGEIARKRAESVTRWAYLVLPSVSARHTGDAVRGFASLRELSRLMVYNDPVYGEPMTYIPTLTDAVWNGHLQAKPVDQLYLFDYAPPDQVAPQLATLLLLRAGRQVHDRVRADAVNQYRALPDRAEGRLLVGALGCHGVALPVERLVERRAAQYVLDVLDVWLTDSGADQAGHEKAMQLLSGLALGRQVEAWYTGAHEMRLLADRLRNEAVHRLDRWLFAGLDMSALVRGARLSVDVDRLRFDVGKPPPDDSLFGAMTAALRVDVAEYLHAASTLLALFDISDERDELAPGAGGVYHRLVMQAAWHQAARFGSVLATFLQRTLNAPVREDTAAGPPALALALLDALKQILQHVHDALHLAVEQRDPAVLDSARTAYRYARRALLGNAPNRWAVRDALADFAEQTQHYVEALRGYHLLPALLAVLEAWFGAVCAAYDTLEGWFGALRDHPDSLAARCRSQLEAQRFYQAANQKLIVPSDLGNPRPVDFIEKLRWEVILSDQMQVNLTLNEMALHLPGCEDWASTNSAAWLAVARAPFERFASRRSVLDYLPDRPEVLAAELRAAETQMLDYQHGADSVQNVRGLLVVGPVAGAPHHNRYIEATAAALRAAHGQIAADQAIVQRQDGSDPARLGYMFITERIDLTDEVMAYTALAERYRNTPGGVLEHQHVLAAERWAVHYERLLVPPDFEPRRLHPRVVALLAHHARCIEFLHAEALGLVVVGEQGYQLSLPGGKMWLLGENRLDAMRHYGSGAALSPVDFDAVPGAVRAAMQAYVAERTSEPGELDVGRTVPALRYNLTGARERGLYAEMVATLAALDLFNEYSARLAAQRRALEDAFDPVMADLLDLSRLLLRPHIERLERRALQYGKHIS